MARVDRLIEPFLHFLPERQRGIVLQMSRYAIAGFAITLAVAASYWAMAEFAGLDPMLSFTAVFLVFWLVSYVTHGAFSFHDHGSRDRQHIRASRYLVVTLAGFALNQFFVWLLVKHFDGPTWWPTVPMICLTPLVLFVLMRRFVYA